MKQEQKQFLYKQTNKQQLNTGTRKQTFQVQINLKVKLETKTAETQARLRTI